MELQRKDNENERARATLSCTKVCVPSMVNNVSRGIVARGVRLFWVGCRLFAEGGQGAVGVEADDAAGGDGRVVERGVVG